MTNLEAKCIALELAVLSGDHASANKVVDELAKTERNFVLKKDQTTVELEKARLDSQHIRDAMATMKDFFARGKDKSSH